MAVEPTSAAPAIPFNRPCVVGREMEYVAAAAASGHMSGDGVFTKKCAALLERDLGASKVLLTTSCTHALEMAALLLDLGPDDEVIVPSFTFVSTLNAFVLRGARPVFLDIRENTLNLDERLLAGAITDRTRAMFLVHYAGVACEMEEILAIAEQRGIVVIEDNAHGLYGDYRGRPLGSFGSMSTLSFHETKNFTCGEGGALVLNDPALIERAEIIREKGTDRSRFFRGEVDKYTWVDIGSSYLPSDVLAAFLYGQLEARAHIQRVRARVWQRYAAELSDWADDNGVRLPFVPADRQHPAHLFYLLLPCLSERQTFIAHLRDRGIMAPFHYQPLHLSPMGQRWGCGAGGCPVVERVSDQIVRLPLFNDLSDRDVDRIIGAVVEWRRLDA